MIYVTNHWDGRLAAVILTSGGVGPLQQFTTDKRMLHAAIDRARFVLGGVSPVSSVKAIGAADDPDGIGQLVQRRFAVGTMGAIRYVVEGMRDMPGRKSLVVFSDGFAIRDTRKKLSPVNLDEVHRVTDGANQAAVTIYGVDARGLTVTTLQAQDDVQGMESGEVLGTLNGREEKIRDAQDSLRFLAAATGGKTYLNSNDFSLDLARMLEDQSGYYLLGFRPPDAGDGPPSRDRKPRRLVVKVRRPGLLVRYRHGYLGSPEKPEASPSSPAERLLAALRSPFAGSGVRLRLTPMFVLGDRGQAAIRAILHLDGSDLAFGAPDAAGIRTAKLHIVAMTEGESGSAGGSTERTYSIRVRSDALEKLRRDGLVYALQHEVQKPGPYHLRIAVLDDNSGRIGSASRFVEIPNVAKGSLAMSGITMQDGDVRQAESISSASPELDLSPAIRVFRREHPFSYGVTLYNARLDARAHQPDLRIQARLIRRDRVVWEGRPFPVILKPGGDPHRIPAGSVLTLGEKTEPGDYILELQALRNGGSNPLASEWMDFELR